MRAIELVARRTLEERMVPDPPEPGPGQVVVRVRAIGICGSDMHWYLDGHIGPYQSRYPRILGHEPAGEIVACGPGVTGFHAGQRVAMEPAMHCGRCEYCLSGRHNVCPATKFMGSNSANGFFVDYVTVPATNVLAVPDSMSFSEVTLIEPLSVIVHVLEISKFRLGDTVAILGAGPIGMLTAALAKASGAARVWVADIVPHRLELARKMGADVVVNRNEASLYEAVMDETGGRGVDMAFDAAGFASTINEGMNVARPGGTFVLIGLPTEEPLHVDLNIAMDKELRLQTIKRSNHNDHAALELLRDGRIPAAMITHHLPLGDTPRAFAMLARYEDGVGKLIIEP